MEKQLLDEEGLGSFFGVLGALILALAVPASKCGWVLFLASNFCWLAFAYRRRLRKLLVQTIVFAGTSVLGILNAWWPGNAVQAFLTGMLA
jgi:hypothetical protein